VADLPLEVFIASDSLGWVYQFWQARKKDEVNASEVKIGARELPAVTQLFTEPYMVGFLLDNSLGAWWAARRLRDSDLKTAAKEEELRAKAAIPGVPLDYLRFVGQEDGTWTPAAGTFDGWPEHLKDLKTLDPCCGSGHFLVAAFLMLVAMRMALENLSARDAVDAVLQDNIHGLEIDQRCVELAAFALALSAWTYPGAGGYRPLPELNVACSGLSINARKDEWLALAGDNINLRIALDELYKQFRNAPLLGSLVNPKVSLNKGSLFALKWEEIGPLLKKALVGEKGEEKEEIGVVAKGIAKTSSLLAGSYSLVCTNVPYRSRNDLSESMCEYIDSVYPLSNGNLATVFVERSLEFLHEGGTQAVVTLQDWLFQPTYQKFRHKLLSYDKWNIVGRLGSQAFQTPMWDFNVQLMIITAGDKVNKNFPKNLLAGFDLSNIHTSDQKSKKILSARVEITSQKAQLENPGSIITSRELDLSNLLSKYATSRQGISPADTAKYGRKYWEIICSLVKWSFWHGTSRGIVTYSGRDSVLWYSDDLKKSINDGKAYLRGEAAFGKKGVAISPTGTLFCSLYDGDYFDDNVQMLIPHSPDLLSAIWSYCSSERYNVDVREIDQALKVRGALVKVPFDLDHWTKIAEEKYPHGLPQPYTDDPTQWIFHGHPCGSVIWDEDTKWTAQGLLRDDDTVLHVAVARLLGYRWPAELDPDMELADEQREWVNRCDSLLSHADEDGIVCIPPVRGEASAADRLLNLLAAAYGATWSNNLLAQLLKNADHAGKTLETWLRDKFFTQHCKLFKHRPFIWHIWDGLKDGFAALVNYHKLDTKHLETLIYTYLGDWINRQKQDIIDGVDGAQERLDAAEALKKKLELIHEGEAPYDIFVRWKPIGRQPMGWDPDLNDGVRLNIRPFMSVPNIRKKGAGVLRDKPNIKWTKDRGKDVASAPWYHLFKGDRINDHHLTLSEKRAARENVK
jgi:hypothetical protein